MKEYRINNPAIIKSLKHTLYGLLAWPILIIGLKFYAYDNEIIVGAILISLCIFYSPLIVIHFYHIKNSKGFTVRVDENVRNITFEKDKKFTYRFDQLIVENHLTIYQEDKRRKPLPWSNYSFLKVLTDDNKAFYISSTMMTARQFPITTKIKKYSFWPLFDYWYIDYEIVNKEIEEARAQKINSWKTKFSNLTIEELETRLRRPKDYREIPREAMTEVLKQKKAINVEHIS